MLEVNIYLGLRSLAVLASLTGNGAVFSVPDGYFWEWF